MDIFCTISENPLNPLPKKTCNILHMLVNWSINTLKCNNVLAEVSFCVKTLK